MLFSLLKTHHTSYPGLFVWEKNNDKMRKIPKYNDQRERREMMSCTFPHPVWHEVILGSSYVKRKEKKSTWRWTRQEAAVTTASERKK